MKLLKSLYFGLYVTLFLSVTGAIGCGLMFLFFKLLEPLMGSYAIFGSMFLILFGCFSFLAYSDKEMIEEEK